MNCKKYRACLAGVIVLALICGVLLYVKQGREKQVPTDGMLVEHSVDAGDGIQAWA